MEKVYTFKVSDERVLSNPTGVWVEKETKGLKIIPKSLVITEPGQRSMVIENKSAFYLIKDIGKKQKDWTGQNVFGARTRVETKKETKFFINVMHNIYKLPVKAASRQGRCTIHRQTFGFLVTIMTILAFISHIPGKLILQLLTCLTKLSGIIML